MIRTPSPPAADPGPHTSRSPSGLLDTLRPRRAPGRGRPRNGAHPESRCAPDDPARRHGRCGGAGVRIDGPDDALTASAARGDKKGNPLAIVVLVLWLLSAGARAGDHPVAGHGCQPEARIPGRCHGRADSPGIPRRWRGRWRRSRPSATATKSITRGVGHMCIVDPGERKLSARPGFLGDIFASHPPLEERISRLRAMAYGSRRLNSQLKSPLPISK